MHIISSDAEASLDWIALTDALADGHRLPRAEIAIAKNGGRAHLDLMTAGYILAAVGEAPA